MVPANALPESSQGAGAVASLCHPHGYWTLRVGSESLSWGWKSIIIIIIMALISLLGEGREPCGTLCSPWESSVSFPCWKSVGFGGAAAASWGTLPSSRDVLGSQERCVRLCLPREGAGGLRDPPGRYLGPAFSSGSSDSAGLEGQTPNLRLPRRAGNEAGSLWLENYTDLRLFPLLPAFSMERSIEDITIYSAQYVYTAWHPPAFQANILLVWRGETFQLGVPEMPCPLSRGGGRSRRGSTHLPLVYRFL